MSSVRVGMAAGSVALLAGGVCVGVAQASSPDQSARTTVVSEAGSRVLEDRADAFWALGSCGDGLVQNSIAELAKPDVDDVLQPDPLASLDVFLESAYPALSDARPVAIGATDQLARFAVEDQGQVKAYFDVSLNGAGNWTVSGWTGCDTTLRQGVSS